MIKLKNTKKDSTLVSFENTSVLDEFHGTELINSLMTSFEKCESITIDLKGIIKIDNKGYNKLSKTNRLAVENKCDIRFVNIDDNISEIIDSFTLTSES